VEWQFVHEPVVAVFQVAFPTWAGMVNPLLWHETPRQVSSLPQVVFFVYVVTREEELKEMSADKSFWGWPSSYPPEVLWQY